MGVGHSNMQQRPHTAQLAPKPQPHQHQRLPNETQRQHSGQPPGQQQQQHFGQQQQSWLDQFAQMAAADGVDGRVSHPGALNDLRAALPGAHVSSTIGPFAGGITAAIASVAASRAQSHAGASQPLQQHLYDAAQHACSAQQQIQRRQEQQTHAMRLPRHTMPDMRTVSSTAVVDNLMTGVRPTHAGMGTGATSGTFSGQLADLELYSQLAALGVHMGSWQAAPVQQQQQLPAFAGALEATASGHEHAITQLRAQVQLQQLLSNFYSAS